MSKTATPYGLKAVNHVGGTPYAGSTRLLPIASGYASNLFNGQVVQIETDGTIGLVTTFGVGVITQSSARLFGWSEGLLLRPPWQFHLLIHRLKP